MTVACLVACGGSPEGAAGHPTAAGAPLASERAPAPNPHIQGAEPEELPPPMRAILAAHDQARAEHCAPPLVWSAELAATADGWAAELEGRGCPLAHSQNGLGENLFMATAGSQSPAEVTAAWVDERDQYDFEAGAFSLSTGHFTQVVWIGTQRVGCATRVCNGMDLWVCNYDPPGNVRDGYDANVLPEDCD